MNIRCPRCGFKGHIVNYQCDVCGYKIYSDKSAPTKKNTYIVPISIFAAIILIGFIAINIFNYILKNFMRDTSSPSVAYVGHWRGNGIDIYVKPNGTMTSIYTKDETKILGIWKVTSEDVNKRKIEISWTNAEDSKDKVDYDLTFSEDYKSCLESYVRSGRVWETNYIYIDSQTTPIYAPLFDLFSRQDRNKLH